MTKPTLTDIEILGGLALAGVVVYGVWKLFFSDDTRAAVRTAWNELTDFSAPAISDPNKINENSPSWKKQGLGGPNYPGSTYAPGTWADVPGGSLVPSKSGTDFYAGDDTKLPALEMGGL